MAASAKREQSAPAPAEEQPAVPKMAPYKGTFELSRADAKRLRLAALEHDTSITRLVEAATVVMLDDPAVLDAALRVVEQLARERS
jgi:hypothetical protein